MRFAGLSLLLLLGACGRADQATPAAQVAEAASSTVPSATAVESLSGEWRVAGIDGQSLDEPVGIALSGDATELWWEPRCAGLVRAYRISGARIAFAPAAGASAAPAAPPPPVCAIAVPPRLADVARALAAADTVVRTPANGILISGGGQSLLLFSQ
jgi:hypothetical protein